MSSFSIAFVMVVLELLLAQSTLRAAEKANLRFAPGASNEFMFDTGVLRGKLRPGGRSAGLSSVVHVPTGMRVDASMGLFSHYRLFTANHRYGTAAWDWTSEATLTPDGSVEVHWPSTSERPFELRATYRWSTPNVLDLETAVEAKTNLIKFESFLASYFSSGFTNAQVYSQTEDQKKAFLPAERSTGVWLAFPRDNAAVSLIQDGRWKIEPNPVDWAIRPRLAAPVGFRRCAANGLTGVLISSPKDCFAILTPFQTEPHYSMYLSLFGRDLKSGETARARTRLLIGENISETEILKDYPAFLSGK